MYDDAFQHLDSRVMKPMTLVAPPRFRFVPSSIFAPSPLSWVLVLVLGVPSIAIAADGEPVAMQVWPGGVVTVESHWGLRVVVNAWGADAETVAGASRQSSTASVSGKASQTITTDQSASRVLSRPVNESDEVWAVSNWSGNTLAADQMGVEVVADRLVRVQVDGVNLVIATDAAQASDIADLGVIDALVVRSVDTLPSDVPRSIRMIVPVMMSEEAWGQATAGQPDDDIRQQSHNTLAFVATDADAGESPVMMRVDDKPWSMPADLDEMFLAMEAACSQSQTVFAPLSVDQMNFRPANGSHTPRWNAEHMMAVQLRFFSTIYHTVDETIPVMSPSPRQMPDDYQPAHPNWTGAEEARQMKRVSDFCRRFAYLLDGVSLDEKAPGSRWPTLRALLAQMDRHYSEHTANVVKKFELAGWPQGN